MFKVKAMTADQWVSLETAVPPVFGKVQVVYYRTKG